MSKLFIYRFILISSFFMVTFGCVKSSVNTPVSTPITIITDASATNISTSQSFPVKVSVTSTVPTNGINYSIAVVTESNNVPVTPQMSSFSSTNQINNISIINLPQQKWCIATITAEENNNSNNRVQTSFRIIYK